MHLFLGVFDSFVFSTLRIPWCFECSQRFFKGFSILRFSLLEVPKRHPPKGHPENVLLFYMSFLNPRISLESELYKNYLNFLSYLNLHILGGALWGAL